MSFFCCSLCEGSYPGNFRRTLSIALLALIDRKGLQFGTIHTFQLIGSQLSRRRIAALIARALTTGVPIGYLGEYGIDFSLAGGKRQVFGADGRQDGTVLQIAREQEGRMPPKSVTKGHGQKLARTA